MPPYINWLKQKQFGQFLREEGPKSHAGKKDTPTMGGLIFMLVTAICSLIALLVFNLPISAGLLVLFTALSCGLIGFVDDYTKIAGKSNKGISGWLRLGTELGLGGVLAIALYFFQLKPNLIFIPQLLQEFLGRCGLMPNISAQAISEQLVTAQGIASSALAYTSSIQFLNLPLWLLIPFSMFLIAATANSFNLHDGLDGLAAGTGAPVLATLAVMLSLSNQTDLALIAACASGALCAFLIFNRNPAKVFMGDTGSLFIGSLLAALTIAGHLTIWFIPLSLVYIAETLSVILQVTFFKLTKDYRPDPPVSALRLVWMKLTKKLPGEGKRLFAMAPLHHHFESLAQEEGKEEWHVTLYFWLAQLIICALCLLVFP